MPKKQTAPKPRTRKTKAAPTPVSKRMTDEQFFNYYLDNFLAPNAPKREEYFNLHRQTAKLLWNKYHPTVCLDLGCGPGVFVEEMGNIGVGCFGIEKNPFFQEWYDSQGWLHQFFTTKDFCESGIEECEMITCIEVMEHMTDEQISPVLDQIAANCKHFVFSSTPHRSTQDEEWGHINIKSKEQWKAMFKEHGLAWVEDLHLPTQWTMVFKPIK